MMVESQDKDSNWAPYLAILPQKLDSLVFWSEPELAQLQASTIVQKIGKTKAEQMFTGSIGPIGLSNYSSDECHRIASIIMAYAFDIPDPFNDAESLENALTGDDFVSDNGEDEKTILSMVPLADMLNADADRNNARLSCDNEDLEMRATKPIARGDDIFNDYGLLPRSDLLRRYGYVTDRYAKYDVVELSTEVILSTLRTRIELADKSFIGPLPQDDLQYRIDLAEREDVYDESYDLRHAGVDEDEPSIPEELLALLYLLLLNSSSLESISRSESSLPRRSKLATELVGQVLVVLLRAREYQYATSAEEDEELLRHGDRSHRESMAIQVRLGEKQILREVANDAQAFTGSNAKMRTGIGLDGNAHTNNIETQDQTAPPAKKARIV